MHCNTCTIKFFAEARENSGEAQENRLKCGILFDARNEHAEVQLLEQMQEWIEEATPPRVSRQTGILGTLTIRANLSPCLECAERLFSVADISPKFKFHIQFLRLRNCEEYEEATNKNMLRRLNSLANMELDIMKWPDYDQIFGLSDANCNRTGYIEELEKRKLDKCTYPVFPKVMTMTRLVCRPQSRQEIMEM